MGKANNLREKRFRFSIRIIRLYQFLTDQKREYVLSKQLLRVGTSIGTNAREADNAVSKPDFVNKLGTAQKESDETMYWLELMKERDYLTPTQFESIRNDAHELLKIIRTIILNTRKNL